jgi:hypothetical protein
VVTDYAGGPVTPEEVIAAAPAIHGPLVALRSRAAS